MHSAALSWAGDVFQWGCDIGLGSREGSAPAASPSVAAPTLTKGEGLHKGSRVRYMPLGGCLVVSWGVQLWAGRTLLDALQACAAAGPAGGTHQCRGSGCSCRWALGADGLVCTSNGLARVNSDGQVPCCNHVLCCYWCPVTTATNALLPPLLLVRHCYWRPTALPHSAVHSTALRSQ